MTVQDVHPTPFAATPKHVSAEAPWRWLAAGWSDIWKQPFWSLSYGLVFVLAGIAISFGLWKAGLSSMIPVAVGAFALIGPLQALGLYRISKNIQENRQTVLSDLTIPGVIPSVHVFYVGLTVMIGLFFWVLIALLLYAFFVSGSYLPLSKFSEFVLGTPKGLTMMVIGTFIGGGIAFGIFMLTAFSVPLLMDKKIGALEAIVLSIMAIRKNPGPMALWAWLVALFTAAGAVSGFLGFFIIFPLLGHATWHAYREVFDEV